mmetsp:Transcript_23949/g.24949  ORF Transcript_23949/g.24949 Transcript_23949/m.24949 type:complete len:325 (+) Transcript_23949:11-985(+)
MDNKENTNNAVYSNQSEMGGMKKKNPYAALMGNPGMNINNANISSAMPGAGYNQGFNQGGNLARGGNWGNNVGQVNPLQQQYQQPPINQMGIEPQLKSNPNQYPTNNYNQHPNNQGHNISQPIVPYKNNSPNQPPPNINLNTQSPPPFLTNQQVQTHQPDNINIQSQTPIPHNQVQSLNTNQNISPYLQGNVDLDQLVFTGNLTDISNNRKLESKYSKLVSRYMRYDEAPSKYRSQIASAKMLQTIGSISFFLALTAFLIANRQNYTLRHSFMFFSSYILYNMSISYITRIYYMKGFEEKFYGKTYGQIEDEMQELKSKAVKFH